jgi:hypothetical protein
MLAWPMNTEGRTRVAGFDLPVDAATRPATRNPRHLLAAESRNSNAQHLDRQRTHKLDQGAATIISVLDELKIETATLAFSCANGLYAIRAAQLAPSRIRRPVLSRIGACAPRQDHHS